MVTELTQDVVVKEENFEVGKSYSYFLSNKSDKPDLFVLSDIVSAYGGVQIVCTENGEIPLMSLPESEEWRHGIMGDIENSRFAIEEGYFLIQVHTPDGFDIILNNGNVDPLVVVSRVEKLEALDVFNSFNMQVKTMHRFNASELTFLGDLTKPIMYALERLG